jgi:hypothetical protein
MESVARQKLFGSRRRTEVLILIAVLGETFPTEIARLLDAPLYSVQTIVSRLHDEGILVSHLWGRSRRVSLNPGFPAFEELQALLLRLAEAEPRLRAIARGDF